ncbi:hypothetical protein [Janthinobacterium fluminis]|uniref:DUF1311 domain-containing protein n=1 Tax=Janthinobacterium fluminis TaxID=2987524 RepID=A0ABT5JYS1_9BURK|nr:hypothetical protein [Janthinobacterium fluminis]MDC8757626.1 hypothetical protein [Janthinobacterium fluminis]
MRHLSLLLLFACGACGAAAPAPPAADALTLARIRAAIGAASCDADAQCRTLALGAKSCGGPEFYLAWSGDAALERELRRLAATYRGQREALNAADDTVADCRFVSDPGAVCRPGPAGASCVLRPAAGPAAGAPD